MSERIGTLVRVLVLCACAPSCIGTETDNPVADFETSACKSEGSALRLPAVMAASAALTEDSGDYEGLYCFAWEAGAGGSVRISVFNMIGGCHVDWELGDARLNDRGLRLRVRNDNCAVAGCGSCAYDLSFDVDRVDLDSPLRLSLEQLDCDDEPTRAATTLTLPIDERREGVLCREGGWAAFRIECGAPHFPPCAEEGIPASRCDGQGASCGEAMVCDPRADDSYDLCLGACDSDTDCPLPVEACVAGACRLRETF